MKSEKAKEYLNRSGMSPDSPFAQDQRFVWNNTSVIKAVELAEQEAEDRVREELMRWRDPKEELPEINNTVLVKVIDQLGNEAIYLGSREGDEYIIDGTVKIGIGVCFDNESMPDMTVKVIGWRKIW